MHFFRNQQYKTQFFVIRRPDLNTKQIFVESRPHPILISLIKTRWRKQDNARPRSRSLRIVRARSRERVSEQDRSVTFNHLTLINKTHGNLSAPYGYKNRRYSSDSMSNVSKVLLTSMSIYRLFTFNLRMWAIELVSFISGRMHEFLIILIFTVSLLLTLLQ